MRYKKHFKDDSRKKFEKLFHNKINAQQLVQILNLKNARLH